MPVFLVQHINALSTVMSASVTLWMSASFWCNVLITVDGGVCVSGAKC